MWCVTLEQGQESETTPSQEVFSHHITSHHSLSLTLTHSHLSLSLTLTHLQLNESERTGTKCEEEGLDHGE